MNSHRVQCVIVLGQAVGYILATRSFAVAGPKTWNSLPTSGRDSTLTLKQLKAGSGISALKTMEQARQLKLPSELTSHALQESSASVYPSL